MGSVCISEYSNPATLEQSLTYAVHVRVFYEAIAAQGCYNLPAAVSSG
jgi:hypothetical protein